MDQIGPKKAAEDKIRTKRYSLVTSSPVLAQVRAEFRKFKKLHRPGIEPGPPAWQASILPVH